MAQLRTTDMPNQGGRDQLRAGTREEFPAFPFEPYGIQRHLMRAVYEILSAGGAGIVESPTGTGKTLSLICSVMQWLEDEHRRQMVQAGLSPPGESEVPAQGSAGAKVPSTGATNSASPGSSLGHRHREATPMAERVSSARVPWNSDSATTGQRADAGHTPQADGSRRRENMQDGAAWLRSHNALGGEGEKPVSEPSWVQAHREKQAREAVKEVCIKRERRLKAREEALENPASLRTKDPVRWSLGGAERRRRAPGPPAVEPEEASGAFLLDDWDSGDEGRGSRRPTRAWHKKSATGGANSDSDDDGPAPEKDAAEPEPLKIFFCSRTHSQLSQFVSELRRTPFAKHLQTISLGSRKSLCINDAVRKLGSAGAMNERCLELQKKAPETKAAKTGCGAGAGAGQGSKAKAKGSGGSCPFRRGQGDDAPEQFLRALKASLPADIEDLMHLGQKLGYCPYYGARAALPEADVVVLPYQAVLHRSTREALGINLEGCVVVFDEAHNLVDTVTGIYSSTLSLHQAAMVKSQLSGYLSRFRLKLNPGNRRYIQQLLAIASALHDRLTLKDLQDGSMSTETFLFSLGFDNINLFKLEMYLAGSNVVSKVSSYGDAGMEAEAGRAQGAGDSSPHSHLSAFRAFSDFLTALTSTDTDGRVLTYAGAQGPPDAGPSKPGGQQRSKVDGTSTGAKGVQGKLGGAGGGARECTSGAPGAGASTGGTSGSPHFKYVMLNAAKHFEEVTSAARAVVLAGGTLRPMSELQLRLFPSLPPQAVRTFSCGHIVPRENVLPIVVPSGPSGARFQFSYKTRSDLQVIDELGQLMLNVSTVVPEGIVVFFPSAAYLSQVVARWEASGKLKAIESRKAVLREPGSASEVESTLQSYREAVQGTPMRGCTKGVQKAAGGAGQIAQSHTQPTDKAAAPLAPPAARGAGRARASGAMLLCVVGGRLSEGINFSDGLGRCVVMVGLPFPNPRDPELVERVRFATATAAETAAAAGAADAAQVARGGAEAGACVGEKQLLDAELGSAGEGSGRAVSGGERYYTNLCTKAVNQSIGRAIRHRNDYAAILLVDQRYANREVSQNLPGWILDSPLVYSTSYPQVHGRLIKFVKGHRAQGQQALTPSTG